MMKIENDNHYASRLVSALAAGRGVLLLGQNHSPRVLSEVVRDIAAATHSERADSIRAQLLEFTDEDELPNVRRALALHSPTQSLLSVLGQPWAVVATTAVDTLVTAALGASIPPSRRLRVLFPSQIARQTLRASHDVLTVVRLFGSVEEEERRFLPPLSDRDLRKRLRFEVAAVLNQLPELVGPRGCLAVAGLDEDDWIDPTDLALAVSLMPAASVHWFGRPPQVIIDELNDVLVVHEEPLQAMLSDAAATEAGHALAAARKAGLHPASRHVTLHPPDGAQVTLNFVAEEWRNIRQVGVLLDDSLLERAENKGPEERRQAFREFLRHQQYLPDWSGVGRGFLFERRQAPEFQRDIENAVATMGSVRERSVEEPGLKRRASRLPLLLSGPPACGKSRLLHWLAFALKEAGHAVLYLYSTSGRVSFEAVERVARIIESKGAPHVIVVADELDEHTYVQLNEHLASSGRNTVVVGATTRAPLDEGKDDPLQQGSFLHYNALAVDPTLRSAEVARFFQYLSDRGFGDVLLTEERIQGPHFLLLLYRLLPDARGNIHLSLGAEYDRLLSLLDEAQTDLGYLESDSWVSQLESVRQVLFPNVPLSEDGDEAFSPLRHAQESEQAVKLCLFCAQIGRPLPLDLLLRTQPGGFLRLYADFAEAVHKTGLLHEVEVDEAGTSVLDADHAQIAELALKTVLPRPPQQLELLTSLVDAVAWDENAFPGERADQDYCIEVLRTVGPRGAHEERFRSPESLQVVAQLLARVREENGARITKLLLLEANTLRILADRLEADFSTGMKRCTEALSVLDVAEEILLDRRATAARNAELRNVLNTRATVHGFLAGNLLRQFRLTSEETAQDLRNEIFKHLALVDVLAERSRGLGDPSFYPLDVTFWVYRDTFEQLPDLSESEKVRLLSRMESVLDSATEEGIEANQTGRYKRRVVNLAQLEGHTSLSQELADEMRDAGDFSGECLLIRRETFDPATRQIRSRAAAEAGLTRLESLGSAAFASSETLDLMNALWRSLHLPNERIGGPNPVLARCTNEEWTQWRRILENRLGLGSASENVFLRFCLAWTLVELGEARLGLQEIRAVEPLSGGSRRRVGCLVVVTDDAGRPIKYRASVRRREGEAIVAYSPLLATEVRLPPSFAARFAELPQVGDELELEVGLNYRGLLPWRVV
jgi:hypothetical protein